LRGMRQERTERIRLLENAIQYSEHFGMSYPEIQEMQKELNQAKEEAARLTQYITIAERELHEQQSKTYGDYLESLKNVETQLKDFVGYLEEFEEIQTFSYETIIDLLEKYGDSVIDVIHDEELLHARIQELLGETEEAHAEKYRRMLLANETFSRHLLENNEKLYSLIADIYGEDLKNFKSLTATKAEIEATLTKRLGESWQVYLRWTRAELFDMMDMYGDYMGDFTAHDIAAIERYRQLQIAIDEIANIEIPDFRSSFDRSSQAARAFSEELDLIQIKLGVNARKIVVLQNQLAATFSQPVRRRILHDLGILYRQNQEFTNQALEIYRENLAKELSKLPETLRQQVLLGDFRIELLTDEDVANTVSNIQTLQSTIQSLEDDIRSIGTALVDVFQQQVQNSFRTANFALEELRHQFSLLDDSVDNFGLRNELLASQLILLDDQLDTVMQTMDALRHKFDLGLIDEEQFLTLEHFLHDERRRLESAIHQAETQRRNEAVRLAEEEIRKKKELYEEDKRNALDAIDAKLKAEEKAYRERMQMLDDELKRYNDIIDAKLQAIDRDEDQRTYEQELAKLQEDRAKIQEQINILELDDSLEARNRVFALTEDLHAQDERIAELQHRRNIDLRKQNLNDMKDAKRTEIEDTKKAESDKFDLFKERLEAERALEEAHYDALLQDEEYFNNLKEQLVAKYLSNIKALHDKFRNDWLNSEMEAYARVAKMLDDLIRKRAEAARMQVPGEPLRGLPSGVTETGEQMFWVNVGVEGQQVLEARSSIIARQRERYEEAKAVNNQALMDLILSETQSAIGDPSFRFLRGGETQQTGLHWLDATRQRPERVLSARQTELFGRLVDWLPNLERMLANQQTISHDSSLVINNLLRVDGNVDEAMMPDLKRLVNDAVREIQEIQKKNLVKRGITQKVGF